MLFIGAAKYNWSCTESDDEGCRYIPSITLRDHEGVQHAATGNELYIYRLPELNAPCYGRVIAIEYCYQFNDTTVGPAVFNWIVLILEESNHSLEIIDTVTIKSCELDATSCTRGQPLCCDVINIENFYLPINFTFGVIESSQGNNAGATLLGFADSLPQYQVDVMLINRAEVTLSVGSTIRNRVTVPRGIRMLWFVIGKLTFTTSSIFIYITNHSPLLADNDSEESATSTRSSGAKSSRSSRSDHETVCASTESIESVVISDQTSAQMINEDNHSARVISASIGGVIGGILGLSLVSVIIVLLVIVRRHQLEKASGHINGNDVKGYHNAVYDGMFN
jgi:hypothetical protein